MFFCNLNRGITYLNDTAIIYTDDPILLVMYTADVENARYVLADFCSLMIDYAQFTRVQRYANETYESTDLSIPETLEFLSSDAPAKPSASYGTWQFICLGAGCILLIIALILVFKQQIIALLCLIFALLLIGLGGSPTLLAHMAVTDGTAYDTVEHFSKAFHSTTRGMEYTNGIDSAMAHSEGTTVADRMTTEIEKSLKITPEKAYRTGNAIAVDVTATKANIPAIAEHLETKWETDFKAAIAAADPAVLYDEEGNYLSELADSILEQVITDTLDNWDSFLTTEETTLHLTMTLEGFTPTWKLLCTEEFMDLVNYE